MSEYRCIVCGTEFDSRDDIQVHLRYDECELDQPSPPERLEGKGEKIYYTHHPVQDDTSWYERFKGTYAQVIQPDATTDTIIRIIDDLKAQLASTEVGHLALIEGQQEMIEKLKAQLINEQCEHAKTKGMFEATVIVMNGKASQVTQLTQKLAVVEKENEECGHTFKKLMDANDNLQAENERKTLALEKIKATVSVHPRTDDDEVIRLWIAEALATLSGNEKGD